VNDDDVRGPAQLAASTLIAVCLLYSDVHTPAQILVRAQRELRNAFAAVALELRMVNNDE
jgi:hypothetical protein